MGLVATVIVAIVLLTSMYYQKQMIHIKDMANHGVDPIKARCALYDSFINEGSALICMEVAKK